ncbi:MAG: hypothetical protein D6798_19825 [Deltaproteobacteria bacterium]|nr:MAG: hypothetical protein D6798_19825 [Deltaproteobacteria bacterium]
MTIALRSLRCTFSTADIHATFQHLLSARITNRLPDGSYLDLDHPAICDVGYHAPVPSSTDPLQWLREHPDARLHLSWKSDQDWGTPRWYGHMSTSRGRLVKLSNKQYPVTLAGVLDLFRQTPFELGVVGPMDSGWPWDQRDDSRGRRSYGFSEGHWPHGLACAFKGAGHDRLAHRRWLEHGPWRLIRDEARDLSVVQFHAVDARPPLCVEQAWEGHKRMGLSEEGGVVSVVPRFSLFKPTLYDRSSRTSIVMVHDDRPVPPLEMIEAAKARFLQPYLDTPIDQVRFLFLRESNARRHMHELWLRGLSCHAITATGEVDLLEGYHADPPPPPDWVKAEQDRDGLG